MVHLLIENGILLKPYSLPWRRAGYKVPTSWTPLKSQFIENRVDEILADKPDMPPTVALQQAEDEEGKRLHADKKPWVGWIPVLAQRDKALSKAYREYFKRLNADLETEFDMATSGSKLAHKAYGDKVQWPPDGLYTYHKGEMELVEKGD